jgi:hypothetical protein
MCRLREVTAIHRYRPANVLLKEGRKRKKKDRREEEIKDRSRGRNKNGEERKSERKHK